MRRGKAVVVLGAALAGCALTRTPPPPIQYYVVSVPAPPHSEHRR